MAEFVSGDVVVVPFPFSDLTQAKRRPALVLTALKGDDIILCQITSKQVSDDYAIKIGETDFKSGSLKQISNVRPNRIFTADQHIILYRVGRLKLKVTDRVIENLISILRG